MELFKETRFVFLSWKWPFIAASLLLTAAGLISLIVKGGPRYGIDFQGGAVMDVLWNETPPVERIRASLAARMPGVSVVEAHDLAGSHEVLISTELPADAGLTSMRQTIDETLAQAGGGYSIRGVAMIGPQIGADLRRQAFL